MSVLDRHYRKAPSRWRDAGWLFVAFVGVFLFVLVMGLVTS